MPQEINGLGSLTNPALNNTSGGSSGSVNTQAANSNQNEIVRSQEESRVEQQEVKNSQTQQNQNQNFVTNENIGGTINTFA